jgi:hypothetical protein
MTQTDKQNLAQAYESAWAVVKKSKCVVTVKPYGWFEVYKGGYHFQYRASQLIGGIAVLTARIAEK